MQECIIMQSLESIALLGPPKCKIIRSWDLKLTEVLTTKRFVLTDGEISLCRKTWPTEYIFYCKRAILFLSSSKILTPHPPLRPASVKYVLCDLTPRISLCLYWSLLWWDTTSSVSIKKFSVADPGCLSRIRIFPSRIRIVSIPDLHQII